MGRYVDMNIVNMTDYNCTLKRLFGENGKKKEKRKINTD